MFKQIMYKHSKKNKNILLKHLIEICIYIYILYITISIIIIIIIIY